MVWCWRKKLNSELRWLRLKFYLLLIGWLWACLCVCETIEPLCVQGEFRQVKHHAWHLERLLFVITMVIITIVTTIHHSTFCFPFCYLWVALSTDLPCPSYKVNSPEPASCLPGLHWSPEILYNTCSWETCWLNEWMNEQPKNFLKSGSKPKNKLVFRCCKLLHFHLIFVSFTT